MSDDRGSYENIDGSAPSRPPPVFRNPVYNREHENHPRRPLLQHSVSFDANEQELSAEVAANVLSTDDPTMLCITFRSMFIGVLLTCLMAFSVQFFALRTSPLDVNVGIVILISYAIGRLMAAFLPEKVWRVTTNPGPFTIKEHAIITIMASAGTRTYEAIEAIVAQRLYYNHALTNFQSIVFLLIMHFLAISISGILKKFLIWPASMIWPSSLMSYSLLRTLSDEEHLPVSESRWKMTRLEFFWLVVLCQFVWYWLPGYVFPLLASFSLVCMFAPHNIILSQITGASGLGIGAFEFDWNAWVAYLESPILVPFWTHVNIFVGFFIAVWVGTPLLYYLNIWHSQRGPIISNRVFDDDGYYYDPMRVLDSRLRLNETAYESYGRVNLAAGYAMSFSFMFASMAALIVHTILYHGPTIREQLRSNLSDKKNDIHAKLMGRYPGVSEWWYYGMFLGTVIVAFVFCTITGLLQPIGVLFSVLLTSIFALPTSIITAMTSMSLATTIAGDYLYSLLLPGQPIGFFTFRTFTNTCLNQILVYLTNLKIGHYMKIPPRAIFPILILSAVLCSNMQYLTAAYLLEDIKHICTRKNPAWRCLLVENTYTASIIFGVADVFKPHSKYFPILLAFPVGAVLPIITWCLWKRFPKHEWLGLVNIPIIVMSITNLPPAPAAEFPSWFFIGFIFNFVLYRYANQWWQKYAYIFSAAMSCGVAICGLCIFFLFQNNGVVFPHWWGDGGPTGDACPLSRANYSGALPTNRPV